MTEYLFRKPLLLDEVINTAIEDNTFRSDDLEFTFAARVGTKSTRTMRLVSDHLSPVVAGLNDHFFPIKTLLCFCTTYSPLPRI